MFHSSQFYSLLLLPNYYCLLATGSISQSVVKGGRGIKCSMAAPSRDQILAAPLVSLWLKGSSPL